MTRLWYVVENNTIERIAFLTIGNLNSVKCLYGKFFELLDINLEKIIYIQDPTQFKRVIVPDQQQAVLGRLANFKKKYTVIHEKMMSRVEAKNIKKIYLTRSQLEKQDCINESYFEEFYKRRGYTVIAPEQYSIEEQIAYMKGAEEIACTMGTLSHLMLFARPGTKLTALLRNSINPLIQQMIVNHAKDVDFYIVDVSFNYLPSSHTFKCNLLGPTKYWREYLDAINDKYDEELGFDMSRYVYDYLLKWSAYASTERGWTYTFAKFDNFDVLNSLSTVLFDKPLNREDYRGNSKEKEKLLNNKIKKMSENIKKLTLDIQRKKAEIDRIKSSRSWKITYPLRTIVWLAKRVRDACMHSLICFRQKWYK